MCTSWKFLHISQNCDAKYLEFNKVKNNSQYDDPAEYTPVVEAVVTPEQIGTIKVGKVAAVFTPAPTPYVENAVVVLETERFGAQANVPFGIIDICKENGYLTPVFNFKP